MAVVDLELLLLLLMRHSQSLAFPTRPHCNPAPNWTVYRTSISLSIDRSIHLPIGQANEPPSEAPWFVSDSEATSNWTWKSAKASKFRRWINQAYSEFDAFPVLWRLHFAQLIGGSLARWLAGSCMWWLRLGAVQSVVRCVGRSSVARGGV